MKALTIIALLISNCYLSSAAQYTIQLEAWAPWNPVQVTRPRETSVSQSDTKWYQFGSTCLAQAKWQKGSQGSQLMTALDDDDEFWAEKSFPLEVTLKSACPVNIFSYKHKLINQGDLVELYQDEHLLASYGYNDFIGALDQGSTTKSGNLPDPVQPASGPQTPTRRRLQGSVGNNQNKRSGTMTFKCRGCYITKVKFVQNTEGESFKTGGWWHMGVWATGPHDFPGSYHGSQQVDGDLEYGYKRIYGAWKAKFGNP